MTVSVRFIGSFHSLSGKGTLELRLGRPCRIRDVIKMIAEELPKLELALIDPESENPKTNLLIIVNGQEMSVLDRFETAIKDGDEMVFVPIVHGG
jgi:MoaD family protein